MHERRVLTEHVAITGRDFWGREAEVRLEPAGKPGWYLKTSGGDILITPAMIQGRWRHLALRHRARLHTIEHLLPLRWMVDEVRICPITEWLPYSGDASIFWRAVQNRLASVGWFRMFRVKEDVSHVVSKRGIRSVKLRRMRNDMHTFSTSVSVQYGDLPKTGPYTFEFPCSMETFEEVVYAKTQAWPPKRSRLLWKVGDIVGMGPREDNIAWLNEENPHETLLEWKKHRTLDLLGVLAASLPPDGILVGASSSYRAGHRHDVALMQSIERVGLEEVWP